MITVTADLHLNAQNRLEDFANSLDQIAEIANKGDLLLILGDVYHFRKPTPKEMNVFRNFVNKVKVPIELLIGNHDLDKGESALDEFRLFTHPNVTVRPLGYILEFHGVRLWINHCTIEGVQIGPCQMTLGLKEEIKVAYLKSLNCDFYIAGHVHKAQVIRDNILVPGSIERVDFGERNEKKYVIQIDEKTKKFGFVELKIRPMKQFNVMVTHDELPVSEAIKDAIVKVIFKGTKEQVQKYNDAPWREHLAKYAYSFKIEYDVERVIVALSNNICEQVSLNDSFEEYAKLRQFDELTINKGREILGREQ